MAVEISNTLGSFLEHSMINEKNCLDALTAIDEATKSKKDKIEIHYTNPTNPNEESTYLIPTFGYLKKSINRIDRTLNSLMGLDNETQSIVELSDGEFRKVITSNIPCEAPTITKVNDIENFNFKSNWFFEDMLNPHLFITLDLTGQVLPETKRVMVRRYILNCTNEQIKDLNQKSFNDFIQYIVKNEIRYSLDDDIKDLPPNQNKYKGIFKIESISSASADFDGTITKQYTFDTINYYSVNNPNYQNLKKGDYLEVNSSPSNARYKVRHVENNNVVLELVEGIATLIVGSELKISSEKEIKTLLEIPVGFNEREVIFIKPIDPYSNIAANDWSPGVAFYTNNLTTDKLGENIKLGEFYKDYVVDFGQVVLSYAKDYYPSIREAEKPDAPKLNENYFKIVNNNEHLYTFNKDIIKNYIQDKQIAFDEKNYDKYKELVEKINEETSSYIKPEYRIQGFWNIPNSVYSESTGNQEIIKFKIQYQSLSLNDKINTWSINNIEYSNWVEVYSPTRRKVKTQTNDYEWENIYDYSNCDCTRINQCNIPIHENEKIEIRIKSISEAGYPSNPAESDWSNILIEFNHELNDLYKAIEQNKIDFSIIKLQDLK